MIECKLVHMELTGGPIPWAKSDAYTSELL